jgi:hypothetical protein
MSATNPSFAQLSVAELERGLRVYRFLAMGVRWLLLEDSTTLASSTPLCVGILSSSRRDTKIADPARLATLELRRAEI